MIFAQNDSRIPSADGWVLLDHMDNAVYVNQNGEYLLYKDIPMVNANQTFLDSFKENKQKIYVKNGSYVKSIKDIKLKVTPKATKIENIQDSNIEVNGQNVSATYDFNKPVPTKNVYKKGKDYVSNQQEADGYKRPAPYIPPSDGTVKKIRIDGKEYLWMDK